MNWLSIVCAVIWGYVLTVLKRCKLHFWLFLVGSVGMFMLCLIWLEPVLVVPMQKAVAVVSGMLGELTGVFESYFEKGMLFIQNGGNSLSLYIDFECSGIIETLAFLSLLWFFPVYRFYEKIVVSIAGILAIFFSNVLRIYLICVLIYFSIFGFLALHMSWVMVPIGQYTHQLLGLKSTIVIRPRTVEVSMTP